jgi:hypothetical protein
VAFLHKVVQNQLLSSVVCHLQHTAYKHHSAVWMRLSAEKPDGPTREVSMQQDSEWHTFLW